MQEPTLAKSSLDHDSVNRLPSKFGLHQGQQTTSHWQRSELAIGIILPHSRPANLRLLHNLQQRIHRVRLQKAHRKRLDIVGQQALIFLNRPLNLHRGGRWALAGLGIWHHIPDKRPQQQATDNHPCADQQRLRPLRLRLDTGAGLLDRPLADPLVMSSFQGSLK